ncbi:hypothetical protein IW261DRAFT_134227 [Armillaria novae-zelandiae]|uniref:Uncharacterized protein n=1 Tax=Armillaria novae-zelandiae TaxID=153914 RepID=A0AA39TUQ2_9AGAR|nr:hypothetical protein IW261DRAFT_134227 [Armillaria novae-zelandiae]
MDEYPPIYYCILVVCLRLDGTRGEEVGCQRRCGTVEVPREAETFENHRDTDVSRVKSGAHGRPETGQPNPETPCTEGSRWVGRKRMPKRPWIWRERDGRDDERARRRVSGDAQSFGEAVTSHVYTTWKGSLQSLSYLISELRFVLHRFRQEYSRRNECDKFTPPHETSKILVHWSPYRSWHGPRVLRRSIRSTVQS